MSSSEFLLPIEIPTYGDQILMNGNRRDGWFHYRNRSLQLIFLEFIPICEFKAYTIEKKNLLWLALPNSEWLLLVAVGHACKLESPHVFLHALTLKNIYLLTSGFKFSQLEMSKQLPLFHFCLVLTHYETISLIFCFSPLQEVVLSLLIESFEFAPSEKEIFWQMSNIVSPTVVGGGTKPQLPIMVKLV